MQPENSSNETWVFENRRKLLAFTLICSFAMNSIETVHSKTTTPAPKSSLSLKGIEKNRFYTKGVHRLDVEKHSFTDFHAERSAEEIYNVYSAQDYCWPGPKKSLGFYILLEGKFNPDNFIDYRLATPLLSDNTGTFDSTYSIKKRSTVVFYFV